MLQDFRPCLPGGQKEIFNEHIIHTCSRNGSERVIAGQGLTPLNCPWNTICSAELSLLITNLSPLLLNPLIPQERSQGSSYNCEAQSAHSVSKSLLTIKRTFLIVCLDFS